MKHTDNPYWAFSIFCEDLRVEKSNQPTIVGLLPDNVNVRKLPGQFPKLGIYSRISAPIDFDIMKASIRFVGPDNQEIFVNDIEEEVIERSKNEAREMRQPFVGIVSQAVFGIFTFQAAGIYQTLYRVNDDDERVAGFFQVIEVPPDD